MLKSTLEWLYSLEKLGMTLGLERIESLLSQMGNPQNSLRCIHVAGTNGKGSTCAFINQILIESGYKVGLYTSPHLVRFNERIKINNKEISNADLSRLVEENKRFYTDQSFFEFTTAIAFKYFAENGVDAVVLEVGLGGRLDATNVIVPLVSIITNISLEHTHILGDSVAKIAREKSGIIKNNVPVITLADGIALETIKGIARERGSKLIITKVNKHLNLGLLGKFQLKNASMAVEACRIIADRYPKISRLSIERGLKEAVWHGRMEFTENNVLMDGAHNPDGICTLADELKTIGRRFGRKIVVVGVMVDKDYRSMLKTISEFADYIIFTKPGNSRSAEPEQLKSLVDTPSEIVYSPKNAFKRAKKIAEASDLIIVTGSIYLLGEILNI